MTPERSERFETYYRLLTEWNERMNLTAITEREAVYEKHFYDSLTLAFHLDPDGIGRIADIGSGAGFPGLPLKICFPHLQVLIVDSLGKRIRFLEHLTAELGLSGVTCLHARAEDAARIPEHRDGYDLVTARAVARMNVLSELCLPFARPGGLFAAMKGSDPAGEIAEAERALSELGGRIEAVHALRLPFEQASRHIVVVRKTGRTPARYPRKAGVPAKQPIV
ncbi:MAG: 16S rRNA (guanine(527)-N(7))-methyltransferase [Thermobacillus sp. ZCTH02-B1]|uniref:16S rRNA (guanine(527)-N(7))-methyltransferase RsmG n=1 Tax=Thermobacillus sp. ZCTH02-B1 TaxID=1858795 RepID=UPI000B57857E|nr:16S rRNA (guanine(527)-N(7))-methyltransferase RsmG [Thermobacillus sp. ZCTH02-B1]OUM93726.1 MAG: 16S rRNA (guanine(527)-N(7))-methyltransferase [Thermobacillus sp. ZCTH02-B1]